MTPISWCGPLAVVDTTYCPMEACMSTIPEPDAAHAASKIDEALPEGAAIALGVVIVAILGAVALVALVAGWLL